MSKNSLMSTLLGRDTGTDMFRDLHEEIDRVFSQFRDLAPVATGQAMMSGTSLLSSRAISSWISRLLIL